MRREVVVAGEHQACPPHVRPVALTFALEHAEAAVLRRDRAFEERVVEVVYVDPRRRIVTWDRNEAQQAVHHQQRIRLPRAACRPHCARGEHAGLAKPQPRRAENAVLVGADMRHEPKLDPLLEQKRGEPARARVRPGC